MADMRITRLVKDASGGGSFQVIDNPDDVIKLAGRLARISLVDQFGIDSARDEAARLVHPDGHRRGHRRAA
ncbi:MAG: hypothetical protein V9G08_10675 [Dermatophilaceae bacterium]